MLSCLGGFDITSIFFKLIFKQFSFVYMSRFALIATVLATKVAAHGYINSFTLDGVSYEGFARWNPNPASNAIGWSFTTPDEGPVLDISSPDFVCRQGGQASANYGQIAAGGQIDFFWTSDDKVINPNGWAESHRGPILTYIAPCNGDCAAVDKTALRWTKISESGLVSGTANTQGIWAADVLRQNGGVTSATVPASIAPGKYVVRNEIIALHRAHLSEPEFYAQCGNIEVTGSGTDPLANVGIVASQLYNRGESQIFGWSIYDHSETSWPIPGPPLYDGASIPAASFETPAGGVAPGNSAPESGAAPEAPAAEPITTMPAPESEAAPEAGASPEISAPEHTWHHPGSWWARKARN
ncbi:LOW QUALITY PROTEIN: Endoglucanase-4 [Paramyrothecium foliicola]|nr:LOW QUALITY PROTEIN: Endoglucanase-4 [Paramyrothecium foliicola]